MHPQARSIKSICLLPGKGTNRLKFNLIVFAGPAKRCSGPGTVQVHKAEAEVAHQHHFRNGAAGSIAGDAAGTAGLSQRVIVIWNN